MLPIPLLCLLSSLSSSVLITFKLLSSTKRTKQHKLPLRWGWLGLGVGSLPAAGAPGAGHRSQCAVGSSPYGFKEQAMLVLAPHRHLMNFNSHVLLIFNWALGRARVPWTNLTSASWADDIKKHVTILVDRKPCAKNTSFQHVWGLILWFLFFKGFTFPVLSSHFTKTNKKHHHPPLVAKD